MVQKPDAGVAHPHAVVVDSKNTSFAETTVLSSRGLYFVAKSTEGKLAHIRQQTYIVFTRVVHRGGLQFEELNVIFRSERWIPGVETPHFDVTLHALVQKLEQVSPSFWVSHVVESPKLLRG